MAHIGRGAKIKAGARERLWPWRGGSLSFGRKDNYIVLVAGTACMPNLCLADQHAFEVQQLGRWGGRGGPGSR